jgi:hypothetical protein
MRIVKKGATKGQAQVKEPEVGDQRSHSVQLLTQPGGIGFLKSILGLLKSLKIQVLAARQPYSYSVPSPIYCLKIPA